MRRTSFQNDHPAMGFPIAAQTILLAQGLTGDAASSRAQILKAEEAAPILDAIWKAPSFGKAFELTLEYGCGKALAGITKVAKTCSASSQHELELEGGEADLGRVRPALTKSQCDVLCEGLQLGYRWVPWRPLVPWWDVERTESNVGQVLRCAPQAKMSLGSSPARGLPSRFLGEASGDNKCIIVQSRGQRARVRGTLAARSDASTARSEGELTRWGAFGKFTGKEEDAEVGLTYFGKRYLNAYLGRWISADPLAIHAPGEADLNVYAYVSGSILKNVDPLGLEGELVTNEGAETRAASDQEALSNTVQEDISYNREVYVGVSGDQGGKVAGDGGSGFFRQLLGVAIAVGTLGVGLASKGVREMISGATQQKAHMPPAGGYKTLEQAQAFRNMELAHLSERDGVEYSSATYEKGGRYYFTAPRAGTQGSAEPPQQTSVPRDAIMTDYAHSHPVTLGDPVKGSTAGYDAKVHGQDIISALDGFRELSSVHNVHKDYTETVVHRVRIEWSSAAPARNGELVWTASTLRVGEMVRSGQWKWNSRPSDVPEEMYERP